MLSQHVSALEVKGLLEANRIVRGLQVAPETGIFYRADVRFTYQREDLVGAEGPPTYAEQTKGVWAAADAAWANADEEKLKSQD
eukprot:1653458-Amphidinium_carterae.4